jgi:pyridoxine 4-dehydrogenase
MSTFPLGPLQVRRSGYGAMQLAGSFAFGTPPDQASAIAVLRAAVAAGVDHIDTAQYYGPGAVNDLIREALYPYPDGLAIVSKVAPRRDYGGAVLSSDDPDQLAMMAAARDKGLIAGIGLSNVSLDQLRHAVAATLVVCVQNMFHLADRRDTPVLTECLSRGIAYVPFCALGWPRGRDNPVLVSPVVLQTAARLGVTPAQVALKWLLQLAPNVLLIPGTGSVAHLRQNLAAELLTLDDEALRRLDRVSPAGAT